MTTVENHTIRFYWTFPELLAEVCRASAYEARTLADEKGQPLADRYTLTEDERPFVEGQLAAALNTLLQQFRRMIPDGCAVEAGGGVYALTVAAREAEDGTPLYGAAELAWRGLFSAASCCGIGGSPLVFLTARRYMSSGYRAGRRNYPGCCSAFTARRRIRRCRWPNRKKNIA